MRQGFQFPLFGGLLLFIGVAAGTMILPEVRWLNPPPMNAEMVALPPSETLSDATVASPAPAPVFAATPTQQGEPGTAGTDGSPFVLVMATSGDDRTAIQKLILQVFPDADAATVDAWAETFQGMSAAEISDILEQKKLLSGSLDSIFTPQLQAPTKSPFGQGLALSGREQERSATQQNLRHAWTVGYRRRLVLPGADEDVSRGGVADGLDFIDFSSGRHVKSPQPLHVAFADHALQMFLLQDGSLTRRGDFSIQPDGKLGLTRTGGVRELRNSPVVTDRTRVLRVLKNGEVQQAGDQDSWVTMGRLPVAEVLRPELLITRDGVHFEATAPHAWRELSADEIRLLPGTLELSNVDPAEELQRLDALDR